LEVVFSTYATSATIEKILKVKKMKKVLIILFFCPSFSNAQPSAVQKNIWMVEQWAGKQTNWLPTNARPHYFFAEHQGKLIRLELIEHQGKFTLDLKQISLPEQTKRVMADATASMMQTEPTPQVEKADIEGGFDITKLLAIAFVGLLVYAIFQTENILGQLFWFAMAIWAASSFLV
jgi:hypothetical protein